MLIYVDAALVGDGAGRRADAAPDAAPRADAAPPRADAAPDSSAAVAAAGVVKGARGPLSSRVANNVLSAGARECRVDVP